MHKLIQEPFYNKTDKNEVGQLRILTWNYSYAYGIGSAGLKYYQKSKSHFENTLKNSVKLIKELDPDIVLLQELDFDCKKSHFIDQLKYFADNLSYNCAYSHSWDVPYIPFPYFQFKDHFGKTKAGAGVLSKFKIKNNATYLLPKPDNKPPAVYYFYPYRYIQVVELENGLKFGNVHLEAFHSSTRARQADIVKGVVQGNKLDFFGGDFNSMPNYASQKYNFKDYPTDDYRDDIVHGKILELKDYQELVGQKEYLAKEDKFFTFPSDHPDRKLDHIFYEKNRFTVESKNIIRSSISDHLPVCCELVLR